MVNRKLTKSKKARKSKDLTYTLTGCSQFDGNYTRIDFNKNIEEKLGTFIKSNKDNIIGTPHNEKTLFINKQKNNLIIYYLTLPRYNINNGIWFIKDLNSDDDFSYTVSPTRKKDPDSESWKVEPLPPQNGEWEQPSRSSYSSLTQSARTRRGATPPRRGARPRTPARSPSRTPRRARSPAQSPATPPPSPLRLRRQRRGATRRSSSSN